jgi:hypothetical protein
MWERLGRTDPASLYQAASFRAVTANVLRTTSKSAGVEAAAEDDRAVVWLKQAVAAGFKNVARLRNDADFAALHGRKDFNKLLGDLQPE